VRLQPITILKELKGAQAVATAVFLARKGNDKKEIKEFIEKEFGL